MDNLIDIGLNLMHSSFKKDRVEIIEEAKKVGVNQFIITGTNVHSSHMAAEYASKYPRTLFSTSGVHPHDSKTCNGHTIFELDMPLFLHEREAHNDLYDILKRHDSVVERSVVHCFTGTKQEAQNYVDLGCFIGVTGWICDMKRGRDLQEAVSAIPPEKLMIETDAPFLIPKNFDKKPKKNSSAWEWMQKNLQFKLLKILKNSLKYKEMKKWQ